MGVGRSVKKLWARLECGVGVSGDGEKWADAGYILIGKLAGVAKLVKYGDGEKERNHGR